MLRKRCVIYPKDVVHITGRSERYAQALLHKIRVFLQKEPHQYVTVKDFSAFSGIPEEVIQGYLF